jgi:branched-chain amino acid transport system substrate-binding protein
MISRNFQFSLLLLGLAFSANAKTFRVAGLYAATSFGHYNCTCNQEAACITNAVIKEAKATGLNVSYELVQQEHDLYSTLKAANHIAEMKFDAAIGTLISSDALVASNAFEKAGIPFIAPVASHPDVTAGKRFSVRVAFNDYRQAKLLARLAARELKAQRVVVIKNASQPYSDFLATQFQKELGILSPATKISEQVIIEGASDFRGLVEKALESRPDLIFVPLAQAAIASIYVELEARESQLTILASDTIEAQPKFLAKVGPKSRNIHFIYPKHWNGKLQGPEAARYNRLHKTYCGQYAPSMTTVAAYDAAELLVRALRTNPGLRGEALISTIKTIPYEGMTGQIVRGSDGDPIKPLELFALKNGSIVHWMRYE